MSLRFYRVLFDLVTALGIRGPVGRWVEEQFYARCLDTLVTEYRARTAEVRLRVQAWPAYLWCDRGASC